MSIRHLFLSTCLLASMALHASAVLVTPTGITYTGNGVEFFTEEIHLIDGAGLTGTLDPSGLNIESVTHGNAGQDTGWVTDDPAPGGGDYFVDTTAVVTFDIELGGTYNLTDFVFWSYGFGAINGNSASQVRLDFSTDGGSSFASSQTLDIPAEYGTPAVVPLTTPADANFIQMEVLDNFFGTFGGGDRVGMSEIRFLDSVEPGVLSMIVNRDNGEITFDNGSDSTIEFAGLGLTSASGALNTTNWSPIAGNYDADGDSSISPDAWVPFSETAYDLSEGTLGTGTLTTSTGSGTSSISLGSGLWIPTNTQDIVATYLDANTGEVVPILVQYTSEVYGENDPIKTGDFDVSGSVDSLDWAIYRSGYRQDLSSLSEAEAYLMGDLNGDGINNAVDFGLFKSAWEADNPGVPFSSLFDSANVPEPGSIALLGLGALCVGLIRTSKLRSTIFSALVVALICGGSMVQAELPSLVSHWDLDANANDSFGSNNGTPSGVSFGAVGANANTGTAATFNGTDSTILVPFSQELNPESFTVSLWARPTNTTGYRSPITSRDDGTFGYIVYVSPSGTWEFWTGDGDPGWTSIGGATVAGDSWAHLAISFDASSGTKSLYLDGALMASTTTQGYSPNGLVEMEDLHIGSGSDAGNEFFFEGDIDDVGVFKGALTPSEIQNVANNGVGSFDLLRLELLVDRNTGAVTMTNSAGQALDVDQYEILSDAGSLDPSGWNSIEDNGQGGLPSGDGTGNGWESLGTPGTSFVGEAYLQDASTLTESTNLYLGSLFDTSVGTEDLKFVYRTADGALTEGIVTYFTGTPVNGDFNGDGIVNIADYTVWRDNLGASDESAFAPGTGNGGGVDMTDYDAWKSNFGSTTGSTGSLDASKVPEPSSMILLAGIAMAGLLLRQRKQGAMVSNASLRQSVYGLSGLFIVAWVVLGSTTQAAVYNDRVYTLGDDSLEDASSGITVGTGANNVAPGATLDSGVAGDPSGSYLDLAQAGSPVYTNVATGTYARPGASSGSLGILFDGTDDLLETGYPMNRPDELQFFFDPEEGYPLEYTGITGHGSQLWVYPSASAIGTTESPTTYQSIFFDTIFTGGPAITPEGKWTQSNSYHVDGASGVGGVPLTDGGVDVVGDTWYHVMQHVYINGDSGAPKLAPGSAARPFTSVIYVDGVAVSANNDNINTGGDTAFVGKLVVGAAEFNGDGFVPDYSNHFNGVLDEMEMYVYGDNTSEGGMDYGTFNLFEDNEWIAEQIANDSVLQGTLLPGDANKDGVVNGDGTGDPSVDDVAAFVAGWGTANIMQGAHNQIYVGDWMTWESGDFNHDGVTDFADWYLLRGNHVSPGGLDLGALLGGGGSQVPEPSTLALLAGLVVAAGVQRRFAAK
ncbi:LamG-like jellyroll fold domain-containing protein [Aeoliella mucimassa]|uniref:PEP-CTERM motif protein n=1 Tax=Aeoliella mucimassa TaxID=2527972 RepID=A0A518AMF3_9BACT|nr:LamG-like jellyroll fold domain-containing protein [Aeoliella mucimassa]QDU55886.1 PEP-CTERM motif protein [Aeoliella mucimassa]